MSARKCKCAGCMECQDVHPQIIDEMAFDAQEALIGELVDELELVLKIIEDEAGESFGDNGRNLIAKARARMGK